MRLSWTPDAGQFLCEKRILLFVIDPGFTKSLIRLTTEKWFTDYRRILPLVCGSAVIRDMNNFYRRIATRSFLRRYSTGGFEDTKTYHSYVQIEL